MGLLADWQIRELAEAGAIEPFESQLIREVDGRKILSAGMSGSGYDSRLAPEGLLLNTRNHHRLNPKNPREDQFTHLMVSVDEYGKYFDLPPYGCLLGRSLEYFRMPRDVMAFCYGKSTYARSFVHILVTPLEAGWEGHITIEIVNHSPLTVPVYVNEGIIQVVFFRLDGTPEIDYSKRGGKYQGQTGVTLGKV